MERGSYLRQVTDVVLMIRDSFVTPSGSLSGGFYSYLYTTEVVICATHLLSAMRYKEMESPLGELFGSLSAIDDSND